MDLLGSILGSMQAPPEDKERKKALERRAQLEKLQQEDKLKLSQFRAQMQKRVNEFVKNSRLQKFKFEPMDKTLRAIAHEVADVAGLASFSFGQDEIDRYVMVWKKEFAPSDDELLAYRNGQEWDPAQARLKPTLAADEEDEPGVSRKKKMEERPQHDYHRKYERLLGKDSAKDAARLTAANKSYGFVPSENKRDHRSIEQVMEDSRNKKRQRLELAATVDSSAAVSADPHTTDSADLHTTVGDDLHTTASDDLVKTVVDDLNTSETIV